MDIYVDYKVIGQRIRKARKAKKLTQAKVAAALEISISYVSQIENGKVSLNLPRLAQISAILECDMGELLTGANKAAGDYLIHDLSDILAERSPEDVRRARDLLKAFFRKDN